MAAHRVYLSVIYFASIVLWANVNNYCHCSIVEDARFGQTVDDVQPQIWLTVSPKVDKVWTTGLSRYFFERKLEINWKHAPIFNSQSDGNEEMSACLFEADISHIGDVVDTDNAVEKIPITQATARKGRYRTGRVLKKDVLDEEYLTSDCVGNYVVAMVNSKNVVVAKNCIRAQPRWMEEIWDYIGHNELKEIFIPGTHNSGAFQEGYKSSVSSILDSYVYCHDETVYRQLVYGNRYLDLRVAYKVDHPTDKLWIVHGSWPTANSLRTVLEQVKKFIEKTSKEIVIVDFHRFERGFERHPTDPAINAKNRERHQEVKRLIESILGQYIYRSTDLLEYRTKLNQIIDAGKRVVIGYADNIHTREAHYFRAVRHLWANAQTVGALESFMSRSLCTRTNEATAAMAQLTADGIAAAFNKFDGGIRKMAQDVNWIITEWFDERWSKCANIVATDYFLGTNMVDVAIRANKKRYHSAKPFAMLPENEFFHS